MGKRADTFRVQRNFFSKARALRKCFEADFSRPAFKKKGVWNYFFVPGLYAMMTARAAEFFPEDLMKAFIDRLTEWSTEKLGLAQVGVANVSFYLPGCGQELHNDSDHGTFAYVYSLTTGYPQHMSGGETILIRDDYWDNGVFLRHRADTGAYYIPPRFNQLLVFDDRLVHGVRRVEGRSMSPFDGRVVIQGHIRTGGIVSQGALSDEQVQAALDLDELEEGISSFHDLDGIVSLRAWVTPSGRVAKTAVLFNTLRGVAPDATDPAEVVAVLESFVRRVRFPSAKRGTIVTVPLPIAATG